MARLLLLPSVWPERAGLCCACLLLAVGGPLGSAPAYAQPFSVPDTTAPAPSAAAPRPAQALFVRGLTQSYLEDYAEAATYFEKALERAPGEPAILAALAEAEAGRDNLTSALYYARQARDQAPHQPHYHRTLARLLRRANRPQAAIATYRTLLSRFPDQDDAYLPLARLLRAQQRPRAALRAYRALLDSTSRPPPAAYAEMLGLYEQTGATEGLEEVLKLLIRRRPNVQSYRRRLGRLYVEQERYAEAIPVYEALLRAQPGSPQLLSRLKMLYDETGQPQKIRTLNRTVAPASTSPDQLRLRAHSLYEDARQSDAPLDSGAVAPAVRLLRKALAQDSAHVSSLDLLGTIQYEIGAYAEAAATLQRALDADPRAPDRWAQAAMAHLRAGHPQRAVNVAEEGLLLFPGQAPLLRPLAFARLRRGAYNAALTRFRNALDGAEASPNTATLRAALHAGRGLAHDRLGHPDSARAAYRAALALDSTQPTALRHFAFHLLRQNQRSNRALQLAQRAVQAHPTDPKALDTLGWVYFKRGAPSKAQTYLQKAVDTGAAPAVVYDHLGTVHRALGNDTLARQYWKKALERDPDRDAVRQKLQSLPQS